MNIAKALHILKAKNDDYYDSHKQILSALNIEHTKTFKYYVELIHNDTLTWINTFPKKYCSIGALAKPKSAIIHLLERDEETIQDLGKTFCDEVAKHITRVWKANWKSILKEREAGKQEDAPEQTKTKKTKKTKLQVIKEPLPSDEEKCNDVLPDDKDNTNDMLDQAVNQIQKLTKQIDESEKTLEQEKNKYTNILDRIEKLKVVLITILKNKGANESDIEVYNAVFTMLH